jgi:hypothetical protein
MALTLADYVNFITPKVGQTDTVSRGLCREFIKHRYRMIYDMRNWKDALVLKTGLSVTTTGVMDYPADVERIVAIRSTGTHMLTPTDSAFIMLQDPALFEQTGDPLSWEDYYEPSASQDNPGAGTHKIRVFPTPQVTTAIILQGKRIFDQLVQDSDSPALRNIDQALIAFGTADMLQRQRQYAKAQAVLQEAAAALDGMVRAETERAGHQVRVVPYTEDYGVEEILDRLTVGTTSPMTTAETGITQLVNGQGFIAVPFTVQKPDTTWEFDGWPVVVNTTDVSPLSIFATVLTSKTVTGFTLQLNSSPDSNNYYLHWSVGI